MNTLVIIGASGHGKVVADAALASGKWDDIVFLDSRWPDLQRCGPWPVVGSDERQPLVESTPFVVAIGKTATRQRLQQHFQTLGWLPQTVIHPSATVSPYAQLGCGTVVCAGGIVNPFAVLGESCIVNTGASVDHDCQLADAVHIAPGVHIAGDVAIGERSWIGIGVSVIQGVRIAADVMVGAGAVVVGDLDLPGLYLGAPARRVDKGR